MTKRKPVDKTNNVLDIRYTENWDLATGNLLNPGVNWSAMEMSVALIKPRYADGNGIHDFKLIDITD